MLTRNEYIDNAWENRDVSVRMFLEVDGEEVGYKIVPIDSIDYPLQSELELAVSDFFSSEYNDKLGEE